jgi:hypothetical protein
VGHLGRMKDEYRGLIDRLAGGRYALPAPDDEAARAGWREILEILYSPEEAALAAHIPSRPTPLAELARRVGLPEAELRARLEPLCERGVVMDFVHPRTGASAYLLSPSMTGFIELSFMRASDGIPKRRLAEAFDAYAHGDDTFVREVYGHETALGRALVHEDALAAELPDVLAWERATAVIGEARAITVSLCTCRHKAAHLGRACARAQETCLSLDGAADFVARRGFGRLVSREEALDVLARARGEGLVQVADNVRSRPTFVCNCCGCCCEQLRAASVYGLAAVNPSGFVPRRGERSCSGCAACARACPVAALSMAPRRGGGVAGDGGGA